MMNATTLLDTLRDHARQTPDRIVFTFVDDNGRDQDTMTFGQIVAAGDAIGAPLRMDLDGKVWITYVRTRAADGSTVEWQIHEGGGEARASSAGTGDAGEGDGGDEAGNSPVDWSSRIGSPGSSASIGDLELEAGENLVIAEAILHFRPLVGLVVTEPREIYTRAYARPRYGIVLYQQ